MKRPSFPMSDVRLANLGVIASSLGCGGWRAMLRMIADGELVVSRPKSKHVFDAKNYPEPVSVIPAGPMIPASVPAWNTPVAKGEFVTEREDGYFVDTEEFDKPVPQRRVPASEPVPPVVSNVQIPQYGSKEEKLAALAKLGLMKGSQLT